MPVLLVIDDEPLIHECFRHLFAEGDTTLLCALSGTDGLKQFSQARPDVVLLDVQLPDLTGLDVFRRLRVLGPDVPVILMTGHGTADTAIQAMQLGAYEYLSKPLDMKEVLEWVARAVEIARAPRPPRVALERGLPAGPADVLVGRCPAIQEVYKAIGRVAQQDVTVLIRGESGTGKELVARAIYQYSHRASGPFLTINCAALPESLLESELFGHEKGSFTGAEKRRIGKFEQAHQGTLFLDEIGDMSPLTQAKVLRVLQDGQVERVGGTETIAPDVRFIAATNRDLEELMATGGFRRDLYYRLSVSTITLPPLRDRPEDLPLLVEHFLKRFCRDLGKGVLTISAEALELIRDYAWPGNVRELQSALKQAILQATGPVLLPEFLPALLRGEKGPQAPGSAARQTLAALDCLVQERLQAGSTNVHTELLALVEREVLTQVLRHTGGNLSRAARVLGITRPTLRAKLALLGVSLERSISLEGEAM